MILTRRNVRIVKLYIDLQKNQSLVGRVARSLERLYLQGIRVAKKFAKKILGRS